MPQRIDDQLDGNRRTYNGFETFERCYAFCKAPIDGHFWGPVSDKLDLVEQLSALRWETLVATMIQDTIPETFTALLRNRVIRNRRGVLRNHFEEGLGTQY